MLILSRKAGQTILIGKTIKITVLEVHRGQARIAITAPKDVQILREEIANRYKG